jgi:hypothetical protein
LLDGKDFIGCEPLSDYLHRGGEEANCLEPNNISPM